MLSDEYGFAVKVFVSLVGLIFTVIGLAGLPEDIQKWVLWIKRMKSKIDQNHLRLAFTVGGMVLIVLCWLPWESWLGATPIQKPMSGDKVSQLTQELNHLKLERSQWKAVVTEAISQFRDDLKRDADWARKGEHVDEGYFRLRHWLDLSRFMDTMPEYFKNRWKELHKQPNLALGADVELLDKFIQELRAIP